MTSFDYECHRHPEPDDAAHQWIVIVKDADTGEEIERHHCADGPGFIREARYCEEVPLEQRWAEDAERERNHRI